MNATEAHKAMLTLKDAIGKNATVYIHMGVYSYKTEKPLTVILNPSSALEDDRISFQAADFDEAVETANIKWAEYSEKHGLRMVREMALAIIRITAEQGECTNAALRSDKFSNEDVIKFGERACIDATKIANNGPFSIVTLAGANAA